MTRPSTPNIAFEELIPGELFGHISWNEVLMRADAFWHPKAIAQQATPPSSPDNGDTYLVAASSPTGAWVGHENDLTAWYGAGEMYPDMSTGDGGRWIFHTPKEGKFCYLVTATALKRWSGSAWVTW